MASPIPGLQAADAVEGVAHIIQVALTPVFLLSGIGTLLNLFNTRSRQPLQPAGERRVVENSRDSGACHAALDASTRPSFR